MMSINDMAKECAHPQSSFHKPFKTEEILNTVRKNLK